MTETALEMFRPTATQENFFLRLQRGDAEVQFLDDNRTGKTLCGAMAVAAMFLDRDIVFAGGQRHSMRPRLWRHGPLDIWVVGYDWRAIGHLCNILFIGKGHKKVGAPPIISGDNLQSIIWENYNERSVSECTGWDGSRLRFFPSTGHYSGDPPHCVWIDEQLENEAKYPEYLCKLIDFQGSLIRTMYREPTADKAT